MSDQNPNPQPDLASQFRELGEQLKNMFQSTWNSEESQKLRSELKNGLSELGKAANDAVTEFNSSETGQRLKADAADFKARVESGDVEAKAREEVSKVLNFINTELGKINDQWFKPSDDEKPEA
jgi:vacuolar-type H+-ATPase subunit E/Vma4